MSAKSHQNKQATAPTQSPTQAEGPQDFGSNAAMQEAMAQSSGQKPNIEASVVQILPLENGELSVLVGKGKKHGIQEGWGVVSGEGWGRVDKVYGGRAKCHFYAFDADEGRAPQISSTVSIEQKMAN